MDMFSDLARRDPYPFYTKLRAHGPVCRDPRSGLWLILGHDDVKRALGDHEAFSSVVSPPGTLTAAWLIFADPPRHSRLRALIARAFTSRTVAALEARIGELGRLLLDRATDGGEIELVSEFAMPLPLMVISEMLGAPAEDYARLRRWSDALVALSHTVSGDVRAGAAVEAVRAANIEMGEHVGRLVAERRAAPKEDLLSRLAQRDENDEGLTEEEILGFFQLLMLAGHETTTNLISNAVLTLLEHPDQLALLRAAPELLISSIEEVLRFRSPVQAVFRMTRRAVNIGGETVPAEAMVLLLLGAANRDPRRFDSSECFDIARQPNPHVAFGHGPHFCIGAPLARLEGRIALRLLLERWTRFERASDDPWEPREAFHVHGPASLPIRFELAKAGTA
jgi:cytochrome P450